MAINYVSYFRKVLDSDREGFPNAFWGGLAKGASNAPGIGINTGDYGHPDSRWSSRSPRVEESQLPGRDPAPLKITPIGSGDEYPPALLTAASDVAPNGVVDTIDGADFINLTGKTVPAGERVWAVGPES